MKNTCQICEREIKAGKGTIAHHGYQRPGGGWQTASCWGARHLPYEKSCDQIQPCIDFINNYIANQKKMLKDLMETPPDTLTESFYYMTRSEPKILTRPEGFDVLKNEEKGSYGPGDGYGYEHHKRVYNHKGQIKNSQNDVKRLEKRLIEWKLV